MGLVYGFAALIMVGAFLLMTPAANTAAGSAPFRTALFTSVSAVTVTGMQPVDTAVYWTFFGQVVIAILVFIGGLGFMTGAAFLLVVAGRRIGLQNLLVIREGLGGGEMGGIRRLVLGFVGAAVLIQLLGAGALFLRFYVFGSVWPGVTMGEAAWSSIFHSISAFNNAGFDIFRNDVVHGDSVIGFQHDWVVLGTLASLIVLGGLGYFVIRDLVVVRRFSRFSLDTKLVVVGTVILLIGGAAVFLAQSWRDPGTLGHVGTGDKVAAAIFDSASARTAGYQAIDYGNATQDRLVSAEMLMLVGGASASTAGGIKVNTALIILITVVSTIRGGRRATAFGREIPFIVIKRAMVLLASFVIIIGVFLLLLTGLQPEFPLHRHLFELISAFCTVGLTTGITAELNTGAQIVIMAAMFIGRFGPLTLALWMAVGSEEVETYRLAQERVRIG